MLEEQPTKPLVDPLCVCLKPHPCPEHGKEPPPPSLFDTLNDDDQGWSW